MYISKTQALFGLLFITAGVLFVFSQKSNTSNLADRKLSKVNIASPTIVLALSKLSYEYEIPIGLESILTETNVDLRKIEISDSEVVLSDLLDDIVKQDGRFAWNEIGGVIHVYPTRINRNVCLANLLELPIQGFLVTKDTSKVDLRSKIYSLPGFKDRLSACNFEVNEASIPSQDFTSIVLNSDLVIDSSSLRGVLDFIVTNSESKFWILNVTGENKQMLFVNF